MRGAEHEYPPLYSCNNCPHCPEKVPDPKDIEDEVLFILCNHRPPLDYSVSNVPIEIPNFTIVLRKSKWKVRKKNPEPPFYHYAEYYQEWELDKQLSPTNCPVLKRIINDELRGDFIRFAEALANSDDAASRYKGRILIADFESKMEMD